MELLLNRVVDGCTEWVECRRVGDTIQIVAGKTVTVVSPDAWAQTFADLEALGFVEIFPTDRRQWAVEKERVLALIRRAFQGVILGEGVGLREGEGLDDYADKLTLAVYRSQDEKLDWSAIPATDLDRYSSSLAFFDADGMRFHLPAYLVAELDRRLQAVSIVFHLTCVSHDGPSRFDTLSPTQREAVREFLLLCLSDNNYEFERPLIEAALRDYWTSEGAS